MHGSYWAVSFPGTNVHCVVVSFPGTKEHRNETSTVPYRHQILMVDRQLLTLNARWAFKHARIGHMAKTKKRKFRLRDVNWLQVGQIWSSPSNSPKLHLPVHWGYLRPHLMHVSLRRHKSVPQTAFRAVQPFCRLTVVTRWRLKRRKKSTFLDFEKKTFEKRTYSFIGHLITPVFNTHCRKSVPVSHQHLTSLLRNADVVFTFRRNLELCVW